MKRSSWIVVLGIALLGCGNREGTPHRPMPGSGSAVIDVAAGSGSGTSTGSASGDPWTVETDPDAPPDLAATHELADKACPKVTKPYFYRIEKNGKTSYMLGSRHLGVPLAKMPQVVQKQIRASKQVVFEVAPGDESNEAQPAQPSISDQLGPALWKRYRALVGVANANAVEQGPPTNAMLVLVALYEDKLSALDIEIERVVLDAHIPTGGLETAQFQDRLLHELMSLRMLRAAVSGTPDRKALEKQSFDDLAEYCAGTDEQPGTDAEGRKQLKDGGYTDAEIDDMDEKLVYSRNRDWIPKLEKLFANGDVMVVVGADHLIGQKGVIAALAARGWKTTRVAP